MKIAITTTIIIRIKILVITRNAIILPYLLYPTSLVLDRIFLILVKRLNVLIKLISINIINVIILGL